MVYAKMDKILKYFFQGAYVFQKVQWKYKFRLQDSEPSYTLWNEQRQKKKTDLIHLIIHCIFRR